MVSTGKQISIISLERCVIMTATLRHSFTLYYTDESVYGDDIGLTARNTPALQEMLITVEEMGVKYGLYISEEKTIYMKIIATPSDKLQKVTIGQYNIENVRNFTYLGVLLNNRGTISEEINKRIMTGNKAYFANSLLVKSALLQDQLK
jgi:hypothetical protein